MTVVRTGSRLHFGLIDLRHFGGVGMMIDEPAVEVSARRDSHWSVSGLHPTRIQFVIGRLTNLYPELPPMHIEVAHAPPEHAGFGCGTQVTLAIASAITAEAGRHTSTIELALALGRGNRSAIGIYGFQVGGLLMDDGKPGVQTLSPLTTRTELPEHWRILLITPRGESTWSGQRERDAFQLLGQTATDEKHDDLRRIAECNLFPAARAADLGAFGHALSDFNALAGQMFESIQGGRYASPQVESIVRRLKSDGLTGIGQSSWGPTVFAFDVDEAKLARIGQVFLGKGNAVRITRLRNCGATLKKSDSIYPT
jgi:beta-RFAP synthase